jgi:flavin-binding protein dodecin
MTRVAKIAGIVGSSDKGWEDAAQVAVDEAKIPYMELEE